MSSQSKYFENLDALRFFAAFGVLLSHIVERFNFPEETIGKWAKIILSMDGESGNAGVSFFFVLSGFLISYLLIEEKNKTETISLSKFYFRRILRIWPLYILTLLIGFLLYPQISNEIDFKETANPIWYSLFLANFDNISNGLPQCGILGVQWSIAIEEQFYLVWPIIVLFISRKHFPNFCILLVISSTAFHISGMHKYHTISAIVELAMGGLVAHLSSFYLPFMRKFLDKLSKFTTFLIYMIGVVLIIGHFQLVSIFKPFAYVDRLIMAIFFSFVIVDQNYSSKSFIKLSSFKWLTYLGKISYGIYSLHMVAIYLILGLANELYFPLPITIILTIGLTILLSVLSYSYLERPFLTMKEKFKVVTP